jgi:prefoldin subunit 5
MGAAPYGSPYSREEEIRMLREQAGMIRDELAAIDARISELEKEKKQGGES